MGEKKAGKLKAALGVMRLAGLAPGILIRSGSAFRRFRRSYVQAAVSEGMPESLARELAGRLCPMAVFKELTGQKNRG